MKKIIKNKDEKLKTVIGEMKVKFSISDFVSNFREKYPDDYEKLKERFLKDEKDTRSLDWKKHSMPDPDKYLGNALKDYAKHNSDEIEKVSDDVFKKSS